MGTCSCFTWGEMLGVVFYLFSAHSFPNFDLSALQAYGLTWPNSLFSYLFNLFYCHVTLLYFTKQKRIYSFLWLTGRVLKKYFGKLFFFLCDGLWEQGYGPNRQCGLTVEKGRMAWCYTLDVVRCFCYTLDVVTGFCYTMRWYKSLLSQEKCCR